MRVDGPRGERGAVIWHALAKAGHRQRKLPNQERQQPRVRRHRLTVSLVLALGVTVGQGSAQERPTASCGARLVGDRVLVSMELRSFLDEETLRLVRLGLVGRVHVELGVYRKRWGLFEQTVALQSSDASVEYSRSDRRFLLDRRLVVDAPLALKLPVQSVRLGAVAQPATSLSLRAEARLQVVTVASLSKVAAWATGAEGDQASSDVLTRGLLSAVVEDLTRSAECTCRVETAVAGK